MTSIFSGNLYRNFVKDQNQNRLENYDVNRFQRTIPQQSAQGQREKGLREGLEYHQAYMADLQTKLNEATEKLTNLYRRFVENQAAFRKVSAEPLYTGSSSALDLLPDVTDPSGLPNDYPTGAPNNILPFDDPGRIRNYSYNPYFGSKAIDESDKNVIRTNWQEPGTTAENAYRENGAFWSSLSYLWGWDLDRINATYVTTSNRDDKQVNVTALQPNKTQLPPLRPGDRFPINWADGPGGSTESYPAVNILGLRPGGVDYSHATDSLNSGGDTGSSANQNVAGTNSTNWGWEFDDLPLALEVTDVSQQPDGNTIPTGYRVVYDIPPTHPHYNELRVLNGTEPKILDAPTELVKERINNAGFDYTGTAYFPGSNVVGFQVGPQFRTSGGAYVIAQPGETEYSAPGNYTVASGPIAAFELQTCLPGLTIDSNTRVSFKYRFRVHQNSAQFGSTWDDSGPGVPTRFGFSSHDWNSAGGEGFGNSNTFTVGMPGFDIHTNQPADTLLSLGQAPTANSMGTDYLKVSGYEELFAKVVAVPGNDSAVRVEFYFEGDLNLLEIEVEDFQIVDYTGNTGTWTQGKYNQGNLDPVIYEGDPTFTAANGSGTAPHEVISKYYPNVYQFTQFNDQYSNSYSGSDFNDIVRSPWEFGLLNIGQGSGLSGEMWINLNGRRLNLDHDPVTGQVRFWDGTTGAPVHAGSDILLSDAIQKAYDFITVEHPEDDCGPNPTMDILASNTGTGFPYNSDSPSGGIAVDSLAGFSVGQQVLVNGQPRTIVAMINDAGSPASVTTDPVFENPSAPPIYEYRPPFDTLPPGQRGATGLPVDPATDFPYTIGGNTYTTYADLAAAFAPPAWHPFASDPSSPFYWVDYTQSSSPAVPSRQEVYLDSPVAPAPTSGTIVPVIIIPEPPRAAQFADSDPLTQLIYQHLLLHDEVLAGETPLDPSALPGLPPGTPGSENPLDPGRTQNPWWSNPAFYDLFGNGYVNPATTSNNPTDFITGTSTDTTGTIDRVLGADLSIEYKVSIPTVDVNVLRKENNLLFNFGSIDERDWGIDIVNPYMEFRTAPAYQTVPRYRVDAGGNIFDQFGKGFYDTEHSNTAVAAREQAAADQVYTLSGGATLNGQVSNLDGDYDMSNYAAYDESLTDYADYITSHNRLSLNGDDYNLFDYVPNLNEIPGQNEGATYGERYVGSLPTNFYYYREPLDQSATGSGTPPTAGPYNGDNMPSLNFNGRGDNRSGVYNDPSTTVVHNALMPSWTSVTIGRTEQDAKLHNQQRTTTTAVWQGFEGLGGALAQARTASVLDNVSNPLSALGDPNGVPALLQPDTSSLLLGMGRPVNQGGHLLLYEAINGTSLPHAIPLPLQDVSVFPNPPATSYSFAAYGPETVTRTGSRYVSNFGSQILDGLDGRFDNSWSSPGATALLSGAGAIVSSTHPPNSWGPGLIVHVDNASGFDVNAPRHEVYLGTDETTRYRVVAANAESRPQTLFLVPVSGTVSADLQNNVHADLQIRQLTGEYTVSVADANGNPDAAGSFVRVDYDDRGTQQPGRLDALLLSPETDRVGRLAGDDPRTAGIENDRIGPEVFDSPLGYVQADARIDLNLVSQDVSGNPLVRKLRSVRVEVASGEQLIPNKISQAYSTEGPFDLNGEWPIAIYEGNRQLNPEVTTDLGILIGLSQGIVDGSQATNPLDPRLSLTSTAGFEIGAEVLINGETRRIADIQGNDLILSSALASPARLGDVASLGSNAQGERELALYINKSYAMSANAPVRVILEYDTYEITGYPPTVNLTTPSGTHSETVGFSDPDPSEGMRILPNNTGNGTLGSPLLVDTTTGFSDGDSIDVNGQTYTIDQIVAGNGLVLDRPISYIPLSGEITRTDYGNFLVVGKGRSGGSFDNEFTTELKRIVDNPEYQQLFRHNLFQNVFVTASVSTPFNDLINTKLLLNWDRNRRQVELEQVAFTAYYKSI